MAAVGLLAWIAACKYLDHLPLYRIEQITMRQGVPISRSTLADWIGRIGVALQPLADRLVELLRQHACLHADETPVRQLDPGNGNTRYAYLWVYRSGVHDEGPPIVVFDYQTSRAGAHARAFLRGWRGHLMVDDYAGYKAMFVDGPTELACLANIRVNSSVLRTQLICATKPMAGLDGLTCIVHTLPQELSAIRLNPIYPLFR